MKVQVVLRCLKMVESFATACERERAVINVAMQRQHTSDARAELLDREEQSTHRDPVPIPSRDPARISLIEPHRANLELRHELPLLALLLAPQPALLARIAPELVLRGRWASYRLGGKDGRVGREGHELAVGGDVCDHGEQLPGRVAASARVAKVARGVSQARLPVAVTGADALRPKAEMNETDSKALSSW